MQYFLGLIDNIQTIFCLNEDSEAEEMFDPI